MSDSWDSSRDPEAREGTPAVAERPPGRRPFLAVLGVDLHSAIGGGDITPLGLASALSISSFLTGIPGAALVARTNRNPTLGIVGRFDAADEYRVASLRGRLPTQLDSLRYVDYQQAERDTEELASRLVNLLGRDSIRSSRFAPIPRGGLIVLGMLSYLLHLDPAQLEPQQDPDVPLVVVDDCAFSGSRFGRFLNACPARTVLFAHLYSHPDLRAAIEAQEPRVQRCVAPRDLYDFAPERLGDGYSDWKERWTKYHHTDPADPRYWVGQSEHVCFPWNEPDWEFWDPSTERMERCWRVVPPDLCLKNRPAPDQTPLPIQVLPEPKGPLAPSERCLWGELDGRVVLADIDTRKSFGLDESGSDMWRALIEHGTEAEALASLSSLYQADDAKLQADLHGLVKALTDLGLLTR